jgi:Glycosyltransferase 61
MKLFCTSEMERKYDLECQTRYERTEPLRVQHVSRGIVFPLELSETNMHEQNQYGGVCDASLAFVDLSSTKRVSPPNFISNFSDWYMGANPAYSKSSMDYIDETVVFIGALPKHYGHYILEGLSRLWFFLESSNLKYKCVYISDAGDDRFSDFLKIFGLSMERVVRIAKPTIFKEVIVPEQSIQLHDYYCKEYKQTIDNIMTGIQPVVNEKVYFSKRERRNDRAIGEAPIESVLANNGYAVYFPESMSVAETLSVLKGCNIFLATSGTNIHNSVFLRDGATSVCLSRSAHFHPIQIMIDRMRALNSIYVDAFVFGSGSNWSSGPFFLFPTKMLLSFFKNEKIQPEYFQLYKKYPIYFGVYAKRILRRSAIDTIFPIYKMMKSSKIGCVRSIAETAHRFMVR